MKFIVYKREFQGGTTFWRFDTTVQAASKDEAADIASDKKRDDAVIKVLAQNEDTNYAVRVNTSYHAERKVNA